MQTEAQGEAVQDVTSMLLHVMELILFCANTFDAFGTAENWNQPARCVSAGDRIARGGKKKA